MTDPLRDRLLNWDNACPTCGGTAADDGCDLCAALLAVLDACDFPDSWAADEWQVAYIRTAIADALGVDR